MTGTEPLDRDPAEAAGPAYRDRLGVVSEARPMSRPALLAAVAAVCGTGLLAGLGLFGGSTPRHSHQTQSPAAAVVKAADTLRSRVGERVHERLPHRPHTRHPAYSPHMPHHLPALHEPTRHAHKGSARPDAPHSAGRHSPVRGKLKKSELPATVRHARPSATARTAARQTSAATVPAASR